METTNLTTKQQVTGNIGEWSEWYAFLKILTDRKMYAADSNLERIEDKFFIVLRIIREEIRNGKKIYDVSRDDGMIQIWEEGGILLSSVPIAKIKTGVVEIFEKMKSNVDRTFSIAVGEETMAELMCTAIKAASNRKADLTVVVHDRISPTYPELGFSVKSMLGAASTLLNASGATNFIYRIDGLEDAEVEEINGIDGRAMLRDRIRAIRRLGGNISFERVENENFRNNLRKIDTVFPAVLAEAVLYFFGGYGKTVLELSACLSNDTALREKFAWNSGDYDYKMKNFLVSVALGMTPAKEWGGDTKAHGGYIVVKENGEMVCYHLYNRDEFQEYIFANTKFDTPSTTRHKFGSIYSENCNRYIKLNLQIRFIK